jgi:hypothetical protein
MKTSLKNLKATRDYLNSILPNFYTKKFFITLYAHDIHSGLQIKIENTLKDYAQGQNMSACYRLVYGEIYTREGN